MVFKAVFYQRNSKQELYSKSNISETCCGFGLTLLHWVKCWGYVLLYMCDI